MAGNSVDDYPAKAGMIVGMTASGSCWLSGDCRWFCGSAYLAGHLRLSFDHGEIIGTKFTGIQGVAEIFLSCLFVGQVSGVQLANLLDEP